MPESNNTYKKVQPSQTPGKEVPFSSNMVRLSLSHWFISAVLLVFLFITIPLFWDKFEPLNVDGDSRAAYALSQDYWHYSRYAARQMKKEGLIAVMGDSVVWGEYVEPNGTLSHYLNEQLSTEHFVNLGINGSHPMALSGLVEFYARAVRNSDVLLQYNPLWMSSARHDLQINKEFSFNHPRLVPQFAVKIPCYRASLSEKVSVVMDRYIEFRSWSRHLSITCFDNKDFPAWSLENAYANPFAMNSDNLAQKRHDPVSWQTRGMREQKMDWVDLETSLQWAAFERTIKTLQKRGNRVFVLVGPFNEHCLEPDSKAQYQALKQNIGHRLEEKNVAYLMADPVPSDLYADSSHPLAQGYEMLVRDVTASDPFQRWYNNRSQ